MKKIVNTFFLLIAIATLSLFNSCEKLKDITFDFSAAEVTIDLPAYTSAGDISVSNTVSNNEFKALLDDQKVSFDNLKSVHIKTIHVELIDTAAVPVTFDALDYMHGVISASGLAAVQYATINDPSGTSLDMNPDQNVDLVEYLKAGDYAYGILGHNNIPINHPTKIKVKATFEVTGSIVK